MAIKETVFTLDLTREDKYPVVKFRLNDNKVQKITFRLKNNGRDVDLEREIGDQFKPVFECIFRDKTFKRDEDRGNWKIKRDGKLYTFTYYLTNEVINKSGIACYYFALETPEGLRISTPTLKMVIDCDFKEDGKSSDNYISEFQKLRKEAERIKQDIKEMRKEFEEAVEAGGVTAEVIQARTDKDGKKYNRLKERMDFEQSRFAYLEDFGTNVRAFNAKGDGRDDTIAFKEALKHVERGMLFIPRSEGDYIIKEDLSIPKGVNIVSNGAIIQFASCSLSLEGDNILQGLQFDGKWETRGIKVKGSGCKIIFNHFKNMKTNVPEQTNVINFADYIGDAIVSGNAFDGIKPYLENKIGGDDVGVSRAIRVAGGHNVMIENNVFKNMIGYEDSDYIHIHNPERTNTNIFPYQSQNGYVFGRLSGVVVKGNIFYHELNKSCVKIQASGIKVINNEFIVDYNAIEGETFSVVRSHNNFGTEFSGNKFYNKGSKLVYFAYLEYCEDIIFNDNKIYFDNPITYEVDCISRTIFVVSCKHPVLKNNYIEGYNVKEDIRFDSCKFVELDNNTFKYVQHNLSINRYSINIVNGQIGILNYKFTLENNKWYCESDKVQQINIESVTSIYMNNNNFTNCQFGGVHVGNVSSFTMQNNVFEATSPYIINVSAGCKNIRVIRNKFGSNVSRLINILQPVFNVKAISNDFDVAPTQEIFMVNVSDQDLNELSYVPGNMRLLKYDYGKTWERPKFKKDVGYPYYDSLLNKAITWDGTSWRDAMGNIV